MRGLFSRKFAFRIVLLVLLSIVVLPAFRADAKISGARHSLNLVLPEAKLTNVTLNDALAFLHDVTGANFLVDWKVLEAMNITKDAQINLSLRSIRLEKVLQLILSEAAGGDSLTYYVDQNVIHITSKDEADKQLILVVYYVDDIISSEMPFTNQLSGGGGTSGQVTGGAVTASGVGGGGGGGGGGGSNIFSNSGGGNSTNTPAAKDQKAQDLITLIEKLVRSDVWKDNGGNSTITYYNGNLLVSAPRSVQELIGGPVDN